MPRLLIQVTLIQQEQQVPLSDAMSVTESQRLNVIQITKRHLGLETRALAAVSAGLCTPPPPPIPLLPSGPRGEGHTSQQSLAELGGLRQTFSH